MAYKKRYIDKQDILIYLYWAIYGIIVRYINNKRTYNGVKVSKLQLNIADMLKVPKQYVNYKVGPYYADIVIPEKKLIIEVNGAVWHKDKSKDIRRAQYLTKHGYRVLIIQIYKGTPSLFWLNKQINRVMNYKKKSILYVEFNKPLTKQNK